MLADASSLGVSLTEAQAGTLLAFGRLILDRAIPAGIVAASDAQRIYERHLLDCLRSRSAFVDSDRLCYDLGSGAGLPGVVLAIAVPWCRVVLAETRRLRAAFLEYAVERLSLRNAAVHAGRAEDLDGGADVATARAFAPLERAWRVAAPLLRAGGRLVYFAGAGTAAGDPASAAVSLARADREVAVRVLATGPPLVIMRRT